MWNRNQLWSIRYESKPSFLCYTKLNFWSSYVGYWSLDDIKVITLKIQYPIKRTYTAFRFIFIRVSFVILSLYYTSYWAAEWKNENYPNLALQSNSTFAESLSMGRFWMSCWVVIQPSFLHIYFDMYLNFGII